jgi:hypothetical protein
MFGQHSFGGPFLLNEMSAMLENTSTKCRLLRVEA